MRRERALFWGWVILFSTLVIVANVLVIRALDHSDEAIDRIETANERERARDCINDWRRYEGSREVIDRAMVGSGEALIQVVGGNAEPALVTQYRNVIRLRIADAQEALEVPRCDRQAAQELLEG